jgi:hypothetical protein
MTTEQRAVLNAQAALYEAKALYRRACKEAFPVGSNVYWRSRGYPQVGVVLWSGDEGGSDRLKVRNLHTGREYVLDAWWFIESLRDEDGGA